MPGLPVQGALCFVETDLPLIGTLTLDGIPLLWPKGLAKRINKPGPVAAGGVLHIARELAARFPVA